MRGCTALRSRDTPTRCWLLTSCHPFLLSHLFPVGFFFVSLQSVLRSIRASDPVRFDRLKPWVRIIDAEIATVRPHSGVTPEHEVRALA